MLGNLHLMFNEW